MVSQPRIAFTPTHDEPARQSFVASLKGYVNFGVELLLQGVFDALALAQPEAPATRADAAVLLEPHPLYQF